MRLNEEIYRLGINTIFKDPMFFIWTYRTENCSETYIGEEHQKRIYFPDPNNVDLFSFWLWRVGLYGKINNDNKGL